MPVVPVHLAYLFTFIPNKHFWILFCGPDCVRHLKAHCIPRYCVLRVAAVPGAACALTSFSVENRHWSGFTLYHPFILGTLRFATRGITDSPIFSVHASGGVNITSGTSSEGMTLARPVRLSHFLATHWLVNRYTIKLSPKKCSKDFVRTVGRGTLALPSDLNLGGCKCGNAKNPFVTSERSPQLQNFHGLAEVSSEVHHRPPSLSAQVCLLPSPPHVLAPGADSH